MWGLAATACMWWMASTVHGQSTQPAWAQTAIGWTILRPFEHAPYPHSSREDGWKGKSETYPKAGHYDDSTVGIFIPADYAPSETVNYIVHFHGHKNTVANVLTQYHLPEQLAAAKVNAILLIPQGPKDAGDSGCGKLELDPGGLRALLEEVTEFLRTEKRIGGHQIGKVIISAHSGGYKAAAAVLDHGGLPEQITDVLLFDASYGSLEWFADWCAADKQHRLVSFFTEHLAAANKELMGLLDKAHVSYRILDEKTLSDEQFRIRGPIFMPTTLRHDDVPSKGEYFRRLLQTSALVPAGP
jgi:hypothetical protein